MKRFHEEVDLMKARQKFDCHYRERYDSSARPKQQGGRYRKRRPLDCGNAKCGICHGDKKFGHEPTRQELKAELNLRDQCESL